MEKKSVIPEVISERAIKNCKSVKLRDASLGMQALSVACILDEFSMTSYAPQARFTQLTMDNWREELESCKPNLLMVESAWRGHEGSWWNTVQRFGPELQGIINWCNERQIPTVFWNKEDPVHFNTFLHTASAFDFVFTTDVDCVPKYKAALGHGNVHFLPFAAQTTIHNPLDEFERSQGCSFAGAYYQKYPDRNRDFNALVPVLKELGDFHIYDRNYWSKTADQEFPSQYSENIVGTLLGTDIAVAYKGYDFSLNLNSVKESQSMFARRVFELIASNTLVISNYSRGLGIIFGDLIIQSDGPQEVEKRLTELRAAPNGIERLRRMALRKVLREHTYHQRFAYILEVSGLGHQQLQDSENLVVIGFPRSEEELSNLIDNFDRQHYVAKKLLVVGNEQLKTLRADIVRLPGRRELAEWIEEFQPSFFAHFACSSWYGPEFLGDMVDQYLWVDETFVGIALQPCQGGSCWGYSNQLPSTRGVGRVVLQESYKISSLSSTSMFSGLSVPQMQFLSAEEKDTAGRLDEVSDLEINTGKSMGFMSEYAASLDPEKELAALDRSQARPLNDFLKFDKTEKSITIEVVENGGLKVISMLDSGVHTYTYANNIRVSSIFSKDTTEVYLETTLGLDIILTLIFFDGKGERLGHQMVYPNRNTPVTIPKGSVLIKPGFRILGPGDCEANALFMTPRKAAVHPPIPTGKVLLVTNRYPAYNSIYQNGFIHSRVANYELHGLDTEIFCLDEGIGVPSFREYRGIQVVTGNSEILESFISTNSYKTVLVHFLNKEMWDVLKDSGLNVITWVHGFEAQPWWRRKCAFLTDKEKANGIKLSKQRELLWHEVLSNFPNNWTLVFVSKWLEKTFFEDMGIDKKDVRTEIIHNIVDSGRFPYKKKSPEDRYKVLSVRPYASPIYANDLAVNAVLRLSRSEPAFDNFEFTFIGDGPLFDEVLEPISHLENVHIRKTFLTTEEIREEHSKHGVFLSPCRMDTQGVSRGEAMASGLVPVVTRIAAVPEFVDSSTGLLTAPEDSLGIASALSFLARNPETFTELSEMAALRVSRDLNSKKTTDAEIELIRRHNSDELEVVK